MTDRAHRELFDRASRDESSARAAQQLAAGADHRPVHSRPPHGEASEAARGPLETEALSQRYELALAVERDAWHALRSLPGDTVFDGKAWDEWRAAVEARDFATRVLINYAMSAAAP